MALTRYQHTGGPIPLRALPAAALRASLAHGYGAGELRRDVLAGLVVGVVALPLAMALSIGVGVPPQHGLYTAIVAGFCAALLGGSRVQVSGPTAAFIVILAPIYARFGLAGLLTAGALSGLLLIAMGLLRLGALIAFIPYPVTTGFTAGIATVIATLQLRDLLGLTLASDSAHVVTRVAAMYAARATVSWIELGLGSFTLLLLVGLPRLTRAVPSPLLALPIAALAALLVPHVFPGHEVATIGTRFHYLLDGQLMSGIPRLPPQPLWPWSPGGGAQAMDLSMMRELLPSAVAIAVLAAIESLLSAVVADGMAGTRHDPDAELLGLGVANLLAPFFAGIAATGAIARTATNVRAGAVSPIAAITHALTVLAAVLLLAPALAYLPMTALAALLLLVAWNMSEVRHFGHMLQVAPRSDVAVLLTCYGLTVVVDMVAAVSVGVVLAALLFMRRMASITEGSLSQERTRGEHAELPEGVLVYDIAGPLFFGAAQKAIGTLGGIADRARAVILRMDQVPTMDVTGLVALESALARLQAAQRLTVIVGLREQPAALMRKALARRPESTLLLCPDMASALLAATTHLQATEPG